LQKPSQALAAGAYLLGGLRHLVQVQNLNVEQLFVSHIQVNQAPRLRRRTYRAHGRINRKSSDWIVLRRGCGRAREMILLQHPVEPLMCATLC